MVTMRRLCESQIWSLVGGTVCRTSPHPRSPQCLKKKAIVCREEHEIHATSMVKSTRPKWQNEAISWYLGAKKKHGRPQWLPLGSRPVTASSFGMLLELLTIFPRTTQNHVGGFPFNVMNWVKQALDPDSSRSPDGCLCFSATQSLRSTAMDVNESSVCTCLRTD